MLGKIKRTIVGSTAVFLLLLGGLPAVAMATPSDLQNSLCSGSSLDVKGDTTTNCSSDTITGTGTEANTKIATIINFFSIIVGVVSVIMIIYGGFRYITSAGESGNISTAKNTILYAIIGLVIVALSQFIVKFVLAKATGVQQT